MRAVRLTLDALAVLLLTAFAALAIDWAGVNYIPTLEPAPSPASAPIHRPSALRMAMRARASFDALPSGERDALRGALRAGVTDVDRWAAAVRDSGYELLCLGEHHTDETRRFLARTVLPTIAPDVLMLEASQARLDAILSRVAAGEDRVPLLGADAASLVRAVYDQPRPAVVAGIDETRFQAMRRAEGSGGFRDASIEHNLRAQLRPGRRNAIVFGALHCTQARGWLYDRIRRSETRIDPRRMLSVHVVGVHQESAIEAFAYFLAGLGIRDGSFAIPDTSRLPARLVELFPPLAVSISAYEAAVVFRDS